MCIRWLSLAVLVLMSTAGVSSAAVPTGAGIVPGAPTMATGCNDTVSATICSAFNLLDGPNGVVHFATAEAGWAVVTAQNLLHGGGL